MPEAYGSTNTSGIARAVRYVIPWLLFGALIWVIAGYGTQFMQGARSAADAQGSAPSTVTSTTASVTTTVTGMVATVRVDLSLR